MNQNRLRLAPDATKGALLVLILALGVLIATGTPQRSIFLPDPPEVGGSEGVEPCTPPSGYLPIYDVSSLRAINAALSANYFLCNDLDLQGLDFIPLGSEASPFTGILEGNHRAIKNLSIQRPALQNIGLFAVTSGADVRNLILENPAVTGGDCVGALVGWNKVHFEKVATRSLSSFVNTSVENGTITCASNCGLLGGDLSFTAEVSGGTFSGAVTASLSDGSYPEPFARAVGGLAARTYVWSGVPARISNLTVSAVVEGPLEMSEVGGIIGKADNTELSRVRFDGSVAGLNVGGITGWLASSWYLAPVSRISESYSSGVIKWRSNYLGGNLGGIAAQVSGAAVIEDSFSQATIFGGEQDDTASFGGIVGFADGGEVRRTHFYGSIQGASVAKDHMAGGVSGYLLDATSSSSFYRQVLNTPLPIYPDGMGSWVDRSSKAVKDADYATLKPFQDAGWSITNEDATKSTWILGKSPFPVLSAFVPTPVPDPTQTPCPLDPSGASVCAPPPTMTPIAKRTVVPTGTRIIDPASTATPAPVAMPEEIVPVVSIPPTTKIVTGAAPTIAPPRSVHKKAKKTRRKKSGTEKIVPGT